MNLVRGNKRNALLYSQVNDLQVQYGKEFAATVGIKAGNKVLDMGCGTGEISAFLAVTVGKQGEVLGVDPDMTRIKFAVQQHSGTHGNIRFIHGDCSSQFPHFNEQYYDVHFSSFVFQWLDSLEKENFINAAFKVLKPGGKIAIQSYEGNPAIVEEATALFLNTTDNACPTARKAQQYFVKKSETETLLKKAGFSLLYSEYFHVRYTFATADNFLAFVRASDYYDDIKISQEKKDDFFNNIINKDGTVTLSDPTVYQIIARKDEPRSPQCN